MFKVIKNFIKCDRGNMAIMTAAMAMPMLTLTVGGLEYSELSKIKENMQHSSDVAVLAAFQSLPKGWSVQQKRAKSYFQANLSSESRILTVKTRLRRKIYKKHIILSYTVKTKVGSLFGELSPFGDGTIVVKSTAAYNLKTKRPPRLIGNDYAGLKDGKSIIKFQR